VIFRGRLSVFPPHGKYQLVIEQLEPKGIGAVELAGRVEQLRSSSDGGVPTPFVSPRSDWIAPRSDSVWTTGVNWYLNQFIKLQANLIREERALDSFVPAEPQHFWSRTLRLQFGF